MVCFGLKGEKQTMKSNNLILFLEIGKNEKIEEKNMEYFGKKFVLTWKGLKNYICCCCSFLNSKKKYQKKGEWKCFCYEIFFLNYKKSFYNFIWKTQNILKIWKGKNKRIK